MKIRNIIFIEYLTLEDRTEYDFAIKYAKQCEPRDVLGFGDMTKMSFGDVKDFQYLFTKPDNMERFVLKVGPEKLQHLSVFDFFAFYKYIADQVGRINRIENELLSYTPTDQEQRAGLERFARYGNLIQIDSLALGKIWKYNTVRAMVYEDCLSKLALEKDRNEYQKDLTRINSRRNG